MGVRPPRDDAGEEPEAVTFGIAALAAHLDGSGLEFPANSDEIVRALGNPTIPYDVAGNEVALSDVLDETHFDRFSTEQELLNELHPVFESFRQRSGNSVMGRLRTLLPF